MENIDKKLDLLHACLVIDSIPKKLPKELSEYKNQFNQFKDAIKDC